MTVAPRTLWLTNDLPPRTGGIQQFVANLLARSDPAATLVVGPRGPADARAHDAAQPVPTVRLPGPAVPTPAVARRTIEAARRHAAEVVVLGASWPLGELAPRLRRELGVPVVALSHGLEAGLVQARLGPLVGRATRELAALTTISDYTEQRLARHSRAGRMVRIPPGVDVARFTPEVDGRDLRRRWGIPPDATLVGCVSRLVRRKGQDRLLEVWPQLARRFPDAWLVLVGEGPLAGRLGRAQLLRDPEARVVLAGRAPWEELPACYAALDVFAMPCRTRLGGLDVEGLGIVYLEAQACGVPAVAGRSGGAPEAVRDGVTGTVVDGDDRAALQGALARWIADPAGRAEAGSEGRRFVEQHWSWEQIARRFHRLLEDVVRDHPG